MKGSFHFIAERGMKFRSGAGKAVGPLKACAWGTHRCEAASGARFATAVLVPIGRTVTGTCDWNHKLDCINKRQWSRLPKCCIDEGRAIQRACWPAGLALNSPNCRVMVKIMLP